MRMNGQLVVWSLVLAVVGVGVGYVWGSSTLGGDVVRVRPGDSDIALVWAEQERFIARTADGGITAEELAVVLRDYHVRYVQPLLELTGVRAHRHYCQAWPLDSEPFRTEISVGDDGGHSHAVPGLGAEVADRLDIVCEPEGWDYPPKPFREQQDTQ